MLGGVGLVQRWLMKGGRNMVDENFLDESGVWKNWSYVDMPWSGGEHKIVGRNERYLYFYLPTR